MQQVEGPDDPYHHASLPTNNPHIIYFSSRPKYSFTTRRNAITPLRGPGETLPVEMPTGFVTKKHICDPPGDPKEGDPKPGEPTNVSVHCNTDIVS